MRSVEDAEAACAGEDAGVADGNGIGAGVVGFGVAGIAAVAGVAAGDDAAGAGAGAGADAAAVPAPSITATIVWIGTVCPSGTLISFSTPAEGEGISASTLSVEISNRGSSRSTLSPGFFSHLVMVPSNMLSPIWGMTTSTGIAVISLLSQENSRPGRFWPVNRRTLLVYKESQRNKITSPARGLERSKCGAGLENSPRPEV